MKVAGRDDTLTATEVVEVWNAFTQRWTRGFVVAASSDGGYLLIRAGDVQPLPAAVPRQRVRRIVLD